MLQANPLKPRLTQAHAELTRQISVVNEFGETSQVHIPAKRALTVYLDKKELVTLMTLGAGSVHGCALFKGSDMLMIVEDVGRHNAVIQDAI